MLSLMLVSCIVMTGCTRSKDTGTVNSAPTTQLTSNAQFSVVNVVKGVTDSQRPFLYVTVKNNGGVQGYGLSCSVKALGPDLLETVAADFTKLSPSVATDLKSGDSTIFYVEFATLQNHESYKKLEFEFSWQENHQGVIFSQSLDVNPLVFN